MNDGVRLVRNTFLTRIAVQALTFSANVLVARLLGPTGKGVVALVLLWSLVVASLCSLGLEVGLTYWASICRNRASAVARFTWLYSVGIGTAVGFTFYELQRVFPLLPGATPLIAVLAALLIPLQLCTLLVSAVHIGLGQLPTVNRSQAIAWLCTLIFLAWLVPLGRRSPEMVVSAYVGCQVLQLTLLVLSGAGKQHNQEAAPSGFVGQLVAYSLRAYPGSLAGLLHLSAIGIIVGLTAGAEDAGIYSVAYSVTAALYILPVAVGTVVLPMVARLESTGQNAVIATARAARLSFVLTTVGALLAFTVSLVALPFIFGKGFQAAIGVTALLLPSALAFSISKILIAHFQGTARPELGSYSAMLGFCVVAGLGWPLSARFGAVGAAAAMSISAVTVAAVQVALFRNATRTTIRGLLVPSSSDWHLLKNAIQRRSRAASAASLAG